MMIRPVASVIGLLVASGLAVAQDCVWTSVPAASSPSARYDAAVAYDSVRQRVVVFGGRNTNGEAVGDTWEWDGTAWLLRTSAHQPPARYGAAMAYHTARGRVVLFGGTPADSKTWEWDGTDWVDLPFVNTVIPTQASMAYDEFHKRLFVWGGTNIGGNLPTREYVSTGEWQFNFANDFNTRTGATLVYVPDRSAIIRYGGRTLGGTIVAEISELNPTTGWTQITPGPVARASAAVGYDPVRHKVVISGGEGLTGAASAAVSDAWEYDPITGASQKRAEDGPDQRFGAKMVYDAAHASLLQFGGVRGPSSFLGPAFGDLWKFDGGHSTSVVIVSRPPVSKSVVIGETFSLSVVTQGATGHQWYDDGAPMTNNGRISGTDTSTLTVNPAAPSEQGLLTVSATCGCGTASASTFVTVFDPNCFANCDHSTINPYLNANDFQCYLNLFASGSTAANCDQSTTPPVLNANDFQCFLGRYAQGC